ncbi:MAG: SGNH/GDSL hydrolase family protein [Clostridia bacterium]|nr:SGNH/GDSL hydrolase family protein [Clostridia bacterium]
MKKHLKSGFSILLCISSLFGLLACSGGEAPSASTGTGPVATSPESESTAEPTPEEPAELVSLDGKRVIFIGNSYVYYGRTVINQSSSVMTQAKRENDKGFFYQLCKANGQEVDVTNWTFGGHSLGDIFGAPCAHASSACRGTRHENELKNRYYDYVFVSPGGGSRQAAEIEEDFDYIINFFKEANPNVKIVCLANLGCHGYSSFGTDRPEIYTYYSTLAEKGVMIADWGGLVYRIMHGIYQVPGGTQTYGKNSFIVKDGYHPNMLAGYITTLMAYCTVTGEKAVGQTYSFCNNSAQNSNFNFSAYIDQYYTSKITTNFPDIFASEGDMKGIQELVDQYITEKTYLQTIDKQKPETSMVLLTKHPTSPIISVMFSNEKPAGNGWIPSCSKWALSNTDGYRYFSGLRGDADAIASLAGTRTPNGLTAAQKADLADIRYGLSAIGISHFGLTEYTVTPENGGSMQTTSLLNLLNGHYGSSYTANIYFDNKTYNINGTEDASSPYTALFTLNFGSVRTFEAIGYSSGNLLGFPQAQDVYVSDDGVTWMLVPSACYDTEIAPVASITDKSGTRDPWNNNEPKQEVLFSMNNVSGKYIRIAVKSGAAVDYHGINTREILVFGQ